MVAKAQHEYAVYLFQQGFFADVVTHLDEVLREEETAERWSDWATAQSALSHFPEAERGFRRALELAPDLPEPAVNFGAMLAVLGRWAEAIVTLEGALPKLDPQDAPPSARSWNNAATSWRPTRSLRRQTEPASATGR